MNKENVKFAIDVMKQAKNLQMDSFQEGDEHVCTIDDLHRCGNTACFVGYLVLTEQYKKFVTDEYLKQRVQNIRVGSDGTVISSSDETNCPEHYLGKFLGVSEDTAHGFIYCYNKQTFDFYPVSFHEVKPEHVIEKLELILKGELD